MARLQWLKRGNTKKVLAIKLRRDGSCPFLGEDYLCELQKNHGERFLSTTCATYPRIINHMGDMAERGLTLSCPVAAKLILLRKEPMEFEQVEYREGRPLNYTAWRMEKLPLGTHLIDLQYSCISLLQNRKLTIDQRLILMGFFLEQVEELSAKGQEDEIPALAAGYASDGVAESAAELVGAISLHTREYIRCMFEMVDTLYGKDNRVKEARDQKYLDALSELYRVSKDQDIAALNDLQEIYEGYRASARDLVREYSYIFENCMVNEFFIAVYPFRVRGTVKENYLYFLISYKMMEFLTLVLATVHKDVPREDILSEGLSFFAERMDHSKAYRDHIMKEIEKYRKEQKDFAFFLRSLLDGGR